MVGYFAAIGRLLDLLAKTVSYIKSGREASLWLSKVAWPVPATRWGHFCDIRHRVRPLPFIPKYRIKPRPAYRCPRVPHPSEKDLSLV